jgi:tetratricopeptide (TPR) repeat protein
MEKRRALVQARTLDPANGELIGDVQQQLLQIEDRIENFKARSDDFQRIVRTEVSDIEYKIDWLLMKKRPHEAAALANRFVEAEPRNPRSWNSRGIARRQSGDFRGALADYQRALDLDPREPNIYRNRGLLYGVAGDLDRAAKDMKKALALDRDFEAAKRDLHDITRLKRQGKHRWKVPKGIDVSDEYCQLLIDKFGE